MCIAEIVLLLNQRVCTVSNRIENLNLRISVWEFQFERVIIKPHTRWQINWIFTTSNFTSFNCKIFTIPQFKISNWNIQTLNSKGSFEGNSDNSLHWGIFLCLKLYDSGTELTRINQVPFSERVRISNLEIGSKLP